MTCSENNRLGWGGRGFHVNVVTEFVELLKQPDVLAHLYTTTESARRLADEAGRQLLTEVGATQEAVGCTPLFIAVLADDPCPGRSGGPRLSAYGHDVTLCYRCGTARECRHHLLRK